VQRSFSESMTPSEVVNSLSGEQKQILVKLSGLIEQEQKLIDEIDARRPTPSGILQLPGGSITVCEDEDDWKIITGGLRLKLKKIREEIVHTLYQALDYGLGHLGIIQKQCAKYNVEFS